MTTRIAFEALGLGTVIAIAMLLLLRWIAN